MNVFLAELRQVLIPDREGKHGSLPPLLVTMTVVTGLVDAFSYLVLGHVFVANMTGNVVFLAFALAGAPGFSLLAAVLALAAFALGALAGGGLASRLGHHRGRLLSATAAVQVLLLLASVVLAVIADSPIPAGFRYSLFVLHAQTVWPLVIALVAVAAIAVTACVLARTDSAWARG
jgi:uncharacterized membrane protein YoaK (UPF0700 family)